MGRPRLIFREVTFSELKYWVDFFSTESILHYVGASNYTAIDDFREYQRDRGDEPRELPLIMYFRTKNACRAEDILLAIGGEDGRAARPWNEQQYSNVQETRGFVYVRSPKMRT